MAQEVVELRGHLIDSLILPKVLDIIMSRGACFEIQQIRVGIRPEDPSFARILIAHRDPRTLEAVLRDALRQGAEPVERKEARTAPAPRDGVFPEGFYATTNLDTALYLGGHWVAVRHSEMDSGILVSPPRRSARTVKMADVRKGDAIVVGTDGVRVVPVESRRQSSDFQFMTSEVSTEKPKGLLIANVARLMKAERAAGRPILWVCGPAVVHSGAGPLFEKLIAAGYVQVLFAGNALAAHDIECGLMGTSLGVSMREGAPTRTGHENHLRAINTIRRVGSIRRAVRTGLLKRGIMAACVKHGVDVVLAGSIRDDGPLPEVIRDTAEAQRAMRRRCRKVRLALLVATLLHSVATGNMLPASTRVVCVDIQQAAVTKLLDRGSFQTTGIVTDVQPFLRELLLELGIEQASPMRPTFLMCPPTFYGIHYQINAWMDVRRQADRALALRQWRALRRCLEQECGAAVHTCRARPGLPDITFTANAGLVYRGAAVPSRFRYRERAGEEPFFTRWFRRHGYRLLALQDDHRFEGAGDALFVGGQLFAGYYYRTDVRTHARLGEMLGVRVHSLQLASPRFYHLDTCFAALGPDSALYYPEAFDSYALRVLKAHVGDLLAVSGEEAYEFACNAVVVGKTAILSEPCVKLARALRRRGYAVCRLPFSEFIKAGGAAKCLTLRLDEGQ